MNPLACRIVLRSRGPLEVLDLAARVAQEQAGPLARLSAVTLLPAWLAAVAVGLFVDEGLAGALVLFVLAPALQLPFTLLTARGLFVPGVTARDVLRELPAQASTVLTGMGSLIALALVALFSLGLLWLPVHAVLLFRAEVQALERKPMPAALGRASRLTSDQLGRTLAGAIVTVVLTAWVVVAAEVLGQAVVGWVMQLGAPFGSAVEGDVTPYALLGVALAQPAVAMYRLLLYLDVRTVTEGWDLQVALGAAAVDA